MSATDLQMANLKAYATNALQAMHSGAQIVAFPEFGLFESDFNSKCSKPSDMAPYCEPVPLPNDPRGVPCDNPSAYADSPVVVATSCMAKNASIIVAVNMCQFAAGGSPSDDKYYNTELVVSESGAVRSSPCALPRAVTLKDVVRRRCWLCTASRMCGTRSALTNQQPPTLLHSTLALGLSLACSRAWVSRAVGTPTPALTMHQLSLQLLRHPVLHPRPRAPKARRPPLHHKCSHSDRWLHGGQVLVVEVRLRTHRQRPANGPKRCVRQGLNAHLQDAELW